MYEMPVLDIKIRCKDSEQQLHDYNTTYSMTVLYTSHMIEAGKECTMLP